MLSRRLEPNWLPYRAVNLREVSPAFRDRLLDPGSTTRRMTQDEKRYLRLHLVKGCWDRITTTEAYALGIQQGSQNFIREVELYYDEKLWIWARAVFPYNTLLGKAWKFRKLKRNALGHVLFSDPCLKRSEFQLAKLKPGHNNYAQSVASLKTKPDMLWGRRSVFWFYKKPLLLTEVFLCNE